MKELSILMFVALISIFKLNAQNVTRQELNYIDNKVVYQKVFEFPESSKEKLFSLSKRWIANSFKDSKYVLRTEDVLSGEIIGVGISYFKEPPKKSWLWSPEIKVEYSFMINVKDNKTRFMIYNVSKLSVDNYSDDGYSREHLEYLDDKKRKKNNKDLKNWLVTVELINKSFEEVIEDYKSSINTNLNDNF